MPNLQDTRNANANREAYKDNIANAMTNLEKAVGKKLGIKDVLDYAADRPAELGIARDETYGGMQDAARHLLLSAELHRTKPALADLILNSHEYITGVLNGQTAIGREQDLSNNMIGKEIGLTSKTREEVEQRVLETLPNATLIENPGTEQARLKRVSKTDGAWNAENDKPGQPEKCDFYKGCR